MEEHHHLFQPLLSTTTTTTSAAATTTNEDEDIKFLSSDKAISFRLLSIIFIGLISIYANYEQSKGFDIIIINDIKDSPAGNRFELFYLSNDKATRILQNTSSFIENVLYPDTTTSTNHPKKQVRSVTLRLSTKNNLTRIFPTVDAPKSDEFVINISPSIIMGHSSNDNHAMVSAIQRGMARVWLWDGESRAPPWLVDGLVEYMSGLAGFGEVVRGFGGSSSWDNKDPRIVAQYLDQCEKNNKGFIRRLNQAMRQRWDDRTVVEARNLCDSKTL
ncbi:hypothetical protein LWI29_003662 [Acer saccharum]|uniref:Uncharacterized protein n=1 Tax=Acer saccharum TaxID=4024 RepID=A0AA39SBD6_ACESA|nr:hypothetical protein LWI29_003662 [Acer saccharum]KAK1568474.1 hypothetical protein Q3G72_024972 [Acer saccharum]